MFMAKPMKGDLSEKEIIMERRKFSQSLTSQIVSVRVGNSRTFHLHADLLNMESEELRKCLASGFKEGSENAIKKDDEDPDLFGFFVEYLYRDCSILSRDVQHYSDYVTLARLYAMGERLMAPTFQSYVLWRFTKSLNSNTQISEEIVCDLLGVACAEMTERAREDPMRSHIFWYAGTRLTKLQKSSVFHQMLRETKDLGRHLCLWVGKSQPNVAAIPNEIQYQKFSPESEYGPPDGNQITPKTE